MPNVLTTYDTSYGKITITKDNNNIIQYHQNNIWQSSSNPAYIQDYTNNIKNKKHKEILMLGCGGGCIASALYKLGCHVTVVDILKESFEAAHKYFGFPEDIKCLVGDGIKICRETKNTYDAIIFDMFDENGKVPLAIHTYAFWETLKCLNPNGSLYINTSGNCEKSKISSWLTTLGYATSTHYKLLIGEHINDITNNSQQLPYDSGHRASIAS